MQLVAVLDVMHGEVVRGVGGRRHDYRPIISQLTPSSRPLDVANALALQFGCRELYLADLDAIRGNEPDWALYTALHEQGFRLWVDAGIRRTTHACQLADAGIESIVAGLETVANPIELAEMARAFGRRLVFSLDLYQGEPLGDRDAWQWRDVDAIAAEAIQLGVRRLLVLDLARVGLDGGTGTRELCSRLCAKHPHLSVSAGGGVRHRGDLEELRKCGVQAVLVASALHDGRLTRADLQGL
ncbi:MAG TPA: HisA/HisF-related TIM barrel protein [Gemmataceae bacterium]|jgi:phosphoribosylformimino-5-aminoimidazole carboxamide ribotide isomerase